MTDQKKDEPQGLDAEIGDAPITLVSRDGQKFEVPRRAAFLSTFIKTTAEQDRSAKEIAIERVDGKVLTLVIEYLNHHNGVRPTEIRKVVEDEWDAEFISRWENDYQALFDVILAANYLDINPLLHLGCAKVASKIKGKTHDEIKKMFIAGGVKMPEEEKKE